MTGPVARHAPADADEAARLLAAGDPSPVLTGSLPSRPPDFVLEGLASEGRALLSAEEMEGILDYRPADLTVAVGAGTRMRRLQDALAERGQWLPVSRAGLRRSAGGLVSAAPPTPYADEYGPVRRQVLALGLVSFEGERLNWGRAVMKNVAGYDLPRLACGSRGRLGLVTRVVFRVWPRPAERRRYELDARGDTDAAGGAAVGATTGVDAGEDWRPAAETWSWTAGGQEAVPLVVELAGSEASVEAREQRLLRWAEGRGLDVRRRDARPGPLPAGGRESSGPDPPRPAALRFRVAPGYVADVVAALRRADGVRRLTAQPRRGRVTAVLPGDAEETDALDAGAASAPDAAVEVARGRPPLHRRAEARRAAERVELEGRVLDALGGRPRAWAGDYV